MFPFNGDAFLIVKVAIRKSFTTLFAWFSIRQRSVREYIDEASFMFVLSFMGLLEKRDFLGVRLGEYSLSLPLTAARRRICRTTKAVPRILLKVLRLFRNPSTQVDQYRYHFLKCSATVLTILFVVFSRDGASDRRSVPWSHCRVLDACGRPSFYPRGSVS
jgi:hypothetical protein